MIHCPEEIETKTDQCFYRLMAQLSGRLALMAYSIRPVFLSKMVSCMKSLASLPTPATPTKYAPFITGTVMNLISTSAKAAALQCSGGPNKQMCGSKWTAGATWDGTMGVGQQMSALEVIQANLINQVPVPVTNKTGGTSQGNPAAGGGSGSSSNPALSTQVITGKDKAGAGVLTTLVLISVIGGAWWMIA